MPWKGGCACPMGQEWGGDWTPTSGWDCGAGSAGCGQGCTGRTARARLALLCEPGPWWGEGLPGAPRLRPSHGWEKGGHTRTALHTRTAWRWRGVLMCCCWVRSTDLGILLGMALGNGGLEMWPLTQTEECAVTGFLRDKLQYRNRLQYMVTVGTRCVPCPSSRAHRV